MTQGEMPAAVLFMVHVPTTFRGLSVAEVRRKMAHPANVETLLDELAETIVQYFNKPIDYREVLTLIASQIPDGGGGNRPDMTQGVTQK